MNVDKTKTHFSIKLLAKKGSPELQQRPEYATIPPTGGISGVDGKHISLSCPQD